MRLYQIPDIRLFWSTDPGFLRQFDAGEVATGDSKELAPITYKEVSKHPACINDISFWLPKTNEESYSENDFYDLVRSLGGTVILVISNVLNSPKISSAEVISRLFLKQVSAGSHISVSGPFFTIIFKVCQTVVGNSIISRPFLYPR